MTDPLDLFPPSKDAALARLTDFVPHAGRSYAQRRNYDWGPGRETGVSLLSPYARMRLLDEITITRAVLTEHSAQEADKFIAEVFWRTYWKGWMELRPGVWAQYQRDLRDLHNQIQTQSGLRARWQAACLGQTGIVAFDAWAQELATRGYLHNHTRMWFASIWIFTLGLPWQLGADFFLRHLLDGDAAVNTLSWRWVAGIQTQGKTYLARPDNIAEFTAGRFAGVEGLAENAVPLEAPANPQPMPLPPDPVSQIKEPFGLLIHEDDINAGWMTDKTPKAVAYLSGAARLSPWQMAPFVGSFRQSLAKSANPQIAGAALTDAAAVQDWAKREGLAQVIAPHAPVGPTQDILNEYSVLEDSVNVLTQRRALDSAAWPLATKGFFAFRKHIPRLIAEFC